MRQALKLYRLSYVQKRYRRPADRAQDAYAAAVQALTASGYSAAVMEALYPAKPDDADADES